MYRFALATPAMFALAIAMGQSLRMSARGHALTLLIGVTQFCGNFNFVYRAEQYDKEQVKLFDDVIVRLSAEIEKTALAELAIRLAPIPNAPLETVRTLARDPEVAVAGPLLSRSPRLADEDLVEIARAGSQAHLLAIGGRERLAESVTDVLVERCDEH